MYKIDFKQSKVVLTCFNDHNLSP